MNKPTWELRKFPQRGELDRTLAADVTAILMEAIANSGRATLAVSGGSTPVNFFQLLSRQNLPWEKITVTLVDERWVDPSHPDSNEKLVRETLLVGAASRARFLALKNPAETAATGEKTCAEAVSRLGRFDLVILGMGADGHTASLFPGSDALTAGLAMDSDRRCIAVTPLRAPHDRMSLTLPAILDAKRIAIHICGPEKHRVLEAAERSDDPEILPICAILHQSVTPVSVYYAD